MAKVHGKQIRDATVTSTQAETSTGTVSTVNAGDAAVDGSSVGLAFKDHQHAVATGAATAQIDVGDAAAEGTSSNLAREDHQHALPAPAAPADVTKAAAAAGVATTVARADHKHDVSTAAAVTLTDSSNAEGSATSLARSDHTHAHGDRSGGTLHTAATTSVNGFMSAADKTKLDSLIDPSVMSPKESVRLLATGNVTLSGNQTVDGVTTAPGDRIACFAQSAGSETGIYEAAAGAWTRTADFGAGTGQSGAVFSVEEGSANSDKLYLVTNDAGSDVVGTDTLTVLLIGAGSPRGAGAGLVLNSNDLDVGANADGSITVNANDIQVGVLATDAQHGDLGNGSLHTVATTSVNGFMSGADKTKLDGLPTSAVPTSRNLTAGAGLTGGGDLSADRTFDVVANADASIVVNANDIQVGVLASDAQHGARGGGTQHAAATTSVNGFMSATDKTKLDGIDTGAEVNDTPNQEAVTTQNITGTDTALTDTLDNTPISNASVVLFLNGVKQDQGAGKDYTISGSTITWLASSGTAVDLETTDTLEATYLS
jgi:hypothetical protein